MNSRQLLNEDFSLFFFFFFQASVRDVEEKFEKKKEQTNLQHLLTTRYERRGATPFEAGHPRILE